MKVEFRTLEDEQSVKNYGTGSVRVGREQNVIKRKVSKRNMSIYQIFIENQFRS